jgi:hypothetical protein
MLQFAVGVILSVDDPDRKKRLLVSCPSIGPDAVWARVIKPFVSREDAILPNAGEEVLVAFERGETSSAYVLGSLWNDEMSRLQDHKTF